MERCPALIADTYTKVMEILTERGDTGTLITISKTKSVCPECMKVIQARKCIGEDGIYLVKECDIHGKFQTLIWEGNAQTISPGGGKICPQSLL